MIDDVPPNCLHDLLRPEVLNAFDREGFWVWEGILTEAGRKQWTASLQKLQQMNDYIVMNTDWGAIDFAARGLESPLPEHITPEYLATNCGGSEQMKFMPPDLRQYMYNYGFWGPGPELATDGFVSQGLFPEYFPPAYDDFMLDIATSHPQMMELHGKLLGDRFLMDHFIMLNRDPGPRGRRWHAHQYRDGQYEVEDDIGDGHALTTEFLPQQCVRTLCYPDGATVEDGAELALIPGAHLYRTPFKWSVTRTDGDAEMEAGWLKGKVHAFTGEPLQIRRFSLPPGSMASFVHHMPHHLGYRQPHAPSAGACCRPTAPQISRPRRPSGRAARRPIGPSAWRRRTNSRRWRAGCVRRTIRPNNCQCRRRNMRGYTLKILFIVALFSSAGWGLTVYRIGGPSPQEIESVDYVHLSWEASFLDIHGQAEGLLFEGGSMQPIRVSPDENLSLTARDRRGGPKSARFGPGGLLEGESEVSDRIADGDSTTVFKNIDSPHVGASVVLIVDLGGRFPVNRVRFYPSPQFPKSFVEQYLVRLFDGEEDEIIETVTDNRSQFVDVTFPPRAVDRVLMTMAFRQRDWEIAELEVYADGYVLEGFYQSQVFDLDGPATVGDLRWSGFKDREAQVKIRTRSGTVDDPNRYWRFTGRGEERTFRDEGGQPLTRTSYENLKGNKAGITTNLENWTPWSGPYDFADSTGTAIISPSARQYLQLQLQFLPKGLDGAGLDFVEFTVSQPPITREVVGEIWPVEAEPGQVTPFVYAFKPALGRDNGFDRLVLKTSGQFAGVDSVHVNGERVESATEMEGDQLILSLPRMDATDSQKLVEVFFRAQIFHFGTVFEGTVFDSERPLEVGQQVQAGDATFALDGNQLWAGIQLRGRLISEVQSLPAVVTPNGDAANDVVDIRYTLLELVGSGQVAVDIFDLSGRRVRQLYRGPQRSGRYAQPWDGRGDDDRVVAPGTYVYQVRVDTDEGQEERSGVVSVAY